MNTLRQALPEYLQLRRSLGFDLRPVVIADASLHRQRPASGHGNRLRAGALL